MTAKQAVILATRAALFFCCGELTAYGASFGADGRDGSWKSVLKPSMIGIQVGERDLYRLSELPKVDVLLVDPEMLLIPEPIRLVDGQDKIVERWKTEGKAIAVGPNDDVMAKLAGHLKGGPLVALDGRQEVWLFPRQIQGKDGSSIACHLVAANFDPKSNKSAPQSNVAVRLSNKLFGVSKPKRATYHTIGRPPRELPVEVTDGAVRVVVPELDLWGVLQLRSSD